MKGLVSDAAPSSLTGWRRRCFWGDGQGVIERLACADPAYWSVWFDRAHADRRYAEPVSLLLGGLDWRCGAWHEIAPLLPAPHEAAPTTLLQGGLLFVAFEAFHCLEPSVPKARLDPGYNLDYEAAWGRFDALIALDHETGHAALWCRESVPEQNWQQWSGQAHGEDPPPPVAPEGATARRLIDPESFQTMAAAGIEAIARGDLFQVNLAHPIEVSGLGDGLPLFRFLRAANPAPYACYARLPGLDLVSCSPERLVSTHGGIARSRPIAGTRRRGRGEGEDDALRRELLLSAKERAEHIMLVDLIRNDLGRVCQAGSVGVEELMVTEQLASVWHIVSEVAGQLRPGVGPAQVTAAMFPGGTITGAPKVQCGKLIAQLEPYRRGPYTGSIGWVLGDGSLDLNILIRTLGLRNGTGWLHVGAGIVADSEPQHEDRETLNKAAGILHPLGIEVRTLR